MVVPIDFTRIVTQRATHGQPHDEFNTFTPRLTQVFNVRPGGKARRIGSEVIKEIDIERLVNEPRA